MVLSKGCGYPLHLTAEPVVCAGTDLTFYDRYFFIGHAPAPGVAREGTAWSQNRAELRLVAANEEAREGPTALAKKPLPERRDD